MKVFVAGASGALGVQHPARWPAPAEIEALRGEFTGDYHATALDTLLGQVVAWSTALAPLRAARAAA
jgi:hypothetical protein